MVRLPSELVPPWYVKPLEIVSGRQLPKSYCADVHRIDVDAAVITEAIPPPISQQK